MDRPYKLTPQVQENICKTLMAGVDAETACLREGISRTTYYRWKKLGEEGTEPYASFVDAIEKAMADVETSVTYTVLKASKQNWQAGAWWLRFKKTQGKQQIELTGKDGAPITGVLTQDAADLIRQKILYGDRPATPANPAPETTPDFQEPQERR